jgi:DNA-binding transcriptional MerR regulator
MEKSPDAFRTISEVAELLETPAHVLRFWESRFPQIRPVKRAGGRRYYRPTDVALLTGIKHLLHNEGLTIRGVQKMLREQGVRHVAGLSGQDVPDESASAEAALEAALAANFAPPAAQALPQEAAESAQIVALETALKARRVQAAEPDDAVAAVATPPTAIPAADPEPPIAEAAAKPAAAPADELPLFARMAPPVAAPLRLVDRLRQLPPGSLDTPAARALRDRLASLQVRVAAPPAANPL